ncbi:unnamed protein product [Echinostoma caproni]|uniref:Casc1_N domain-containing protein n=1 Tax=Echinostoma caproni TaxID=27848 RepID=A0A183AVY8_9TREM|nr:unnamed protein product [Echinostoma caproni]
MEVFMELKKRKVELNETRELLQEQRIRLEQLEAERRNEYAWKRYFRCDGSPNPSIEKEVNTFMSLWRMDESRLTMEEVMDESVHSLRVGCFHFILFEEKHLFFPQLIDELRTLVADVGDNEEDNQTLLTYRRTMRFLEVLQNSRKLMPSTNPPRKKRIWPTAFLHGNGQVTRMTAIAQPSTHLLPILDTVCDIRTRLKRIFVIIQGYEGISSSTGLGRGLPYEPKSGRGWTITTCVRPPKLTPFEYIIDPSQKMSQSSTAQEGTPLSGTNKEERKDEKPPVQVKFRLPLCLVIAEEPILARWDPEVNQWRKSGIELEHFKEDENLIVMRTSVFGTMAIFQDFHINMPFQAWELRPLPLRSSQTAVLAAQSISVTTNDYASGAVDQAQMASTFSAPVYRSHTAQRQNPNSGEVTKDMADL